MYKIIGADQQEYGPVTADQIRQWVAEGRANGQTLVLPDGATEWKPLSACPEFAGLTGAASSTPPPFSTGASPPAALTPEELVARDYDLDIWSCLTRSWELVKQNFGPLVGVTFLVVLVVSAVNQGIGFIARPAMQGLINQHQITLEGGLLILLSEVLGMPVSAILIAGFGLYYLKMIRREPAEISDAFSGLTRNPAPLAALGLVKGLLVLLGIGACVFPGIYLFVAWSFAVPLVIDRQLGFWEAMELSRRVVTRHWFMVLALMLVIGLVSVCGIVVCCIGIVATMTIGQVAMMYAYEDLFGRSAR